jgi:predicted DNA-binding transcriptional regulator YafY
MTLAEECAQEVFLATGRTIALSERTIKGDISSMRNSSMLGYYAPIEYDRQAKSYRYTDATFSINQSPINQQDQDKLSQALQILEQLGGLKEILGIQPILSKLQKSVYHQSEKNSSKVILFDQDMDVSGQQWLYRLFRAIVDKKTISIVYQKFGKEKKSYLLSPHLLKEYQKRWYLISFSHRDRSMRTYALDRIVNIKESLTEYHFESSFDGLKYFNNVVGIGLVNDGEIEEIKFKATGVQLDYLKTRPLHKSQVLLRQENDFAIFQINVVINYELISEIFSYRQHLEILSPDSLREAIQIQIEEMGKLYTNE